MSDFGSRNTGFFGGGGGGSTSGVSAVGGTAPISSSGGATPNISISQSSGSTNGFLSSADWSTFNNKVGGSGTANKLPKWASASTLGDSQIFDDGTNVAVGTTTPTSGFLFDVNTSAIVRTYFQVGSFVKEATNTGLIVTNGLIQSSVGINLASVTNGLNKMGFYNVGNSLQIWAGNNQLATFGLASAGGTLFDFIASWVYTTASTGSSKAIRITSSLVSTSANTAGLTQLYIDPTYNQATFGTGTLRGIYYTPITSVLNGSPHIAWENTSGDVIFGNLTSTLDGRVLQVNASGKLSFQDGSFQLYNGLNDDIIRAISGGEYRFGNFTIANTLIFDTTTNTINFQSDGNVNGLKIFVSTNIVEIGFLTTSGGGTRTCFEFNGATQETTLTSQSLKFVGANLQTNTAPAGLGVTYLLVTMPDGIQYSILCSQTT